MSIAFGLAGLCAIVAGLLQILARDMAWKSAKWWNSLEGVKSERAITWEVSSIIQGVMGISLGLSLLWMAGQVKEKRPPDHETTEISTPVHVDR